ncbi:MAG: DUF4377 domain-containing protein [Burkholderiales bacterium]|nr:DUF4377 domain-containing protein [Burkholderiales bacterium]
MPQSIRTLLLCAALTAPALGLQARPTADAGAPTPPRRHADAALVRALIDHRWTLQSATDAAGKSIDTLMVPGHPFAMRFEGGRLSVQGACNNMNGGWRLSPRNELHVMGLAATMKACDPPLMEADKALAAALAQPLDARLERGDPARLLLVTSERQTLSLVGERTPQSLYGKPTRIFLEVAAQTVECRDGGTRTQCLQVRNRRYDAYGLPIEPPGRWRVFHGDIEGYTHQPGVRTVLRIDRYERRPAPAGASRYLYVLDMVVESEIVSR